MKKVLLVFLVAVLIGAGAWYMVGRKPASVTNNQPQPQDKPYDPMNPNFLGGRVVSASQTEVNFKVGELNYIAKIDSSTKLVKQVKEDKGIIKVVDASVNDLKIGSSIIVYFDKTLVANTPSSVTKIQIIN